MEIISVDLLSEKFYNKKQTREPEKWLSQNNTGRLMHVKAKEKGRKEECVLVKGMGKCGEMVLWDCLWGIWMGHAGTDGSLNIDD